MFVSHPPCVRRTPPLPWFVENGSVASERSGVPLAILACQVPCLMPQRHFESVQGRRSPVTIMERWTIYMHAFDEHILFGCPVPTTSSIFCPLSVAILIWRNCTHEYKRSSTCWTLLGDHSFIHSFIHSFLHGSCYIVSVLVYIMYFCFGLYAKFPLLKLASGNFSKFPWKCPLA